MDLSCVEEYRIKLHFNNYTDYDIHLIYQYNVECTNIMSFILQVEIRLVIRKFVLNQHSIIHDRQLI